LAFYVLVFALVWGPTLILAGPGALLGNTDVLADTEVASAADLDPVMIAAILASPLMIALAAVVVIALAFGRAGLRGLGSRLSRWRVGARWYAIALLTMPLVMTAVLGVFSLTSDAFVPGMITADDKVSLVVAALVSGLVAGVFEEVGWTGLAADDLGKRRRLLGTGLLVGLPWCVLHLPLWAATSPGEVPRVLSLAVALLFPLLPYRVLMVWVYRHTGSVPVAMVMHASLSAGAFVFGSAAMVGVPDLIATLSVGTTLSLLAAAVVVADRRGTPNATPRMLPHGTSTAASHR
jgi:membrane protease YdiL (CAAX protease family)